MRLLQVIALTALAFIGAVDLARADDYPTRPITLIVPFPPGGSTTVMARNVADKLSVSLGQQIVVENRGGAGGVIGTRSVARATPDGYTILLSYTATMAIAPAMNVNAGYDPRKDFVAVGMIGSAPSSLVVHPSFAVKTVAELIAYAKANPGKINFGSAGIGTVGQITGEYFARESGIKIVHIPYKGTGPALSDLLGGHIPMSFSPVATTTGNVKGGLLRALAVTSAHRSKLLPDVPTMIEAGVPGFDAVLVYGLVAPAGTPRAVVDRLNKALCDALASDEVKKQLELDGTEITPSTPEQYADFIDKDERKWSELVKASGVEPE
jgi:tripartite-type tricarboxylate transporter receptor subunit TctC